MNYYIAKLKQFGYEHIWRVYTADCLKALIGAENRYVDLLKPPKEETRTAEEIINLMKSKIGG